MVRILRLIGWAFIVFGAIAGFVAWGSQPSIPVPNQSANDYAGITFFLSGVISGILFLSIGEVIQLLRDIRTNTSK